MKTKNIFYSLIATFLMSFTAVSAIEISPTEYVYQLDPLGLTQDVTYYNMNEDPERVKVSFIPYKTDPDSKYLGKWGTIFPRIFTVRPDAQKTVKFSLEPPSGLPEGEYRAVLYSEELEQKALDNVDGKVSLNQDTTTQVSMLVKLGVVVYGYVGDPETFKVSGKVTDLKVANNTVKFNLENDGEITRPYYLIFKGTDKKTGEAKTVSEKIVVVQSYTNPIAKSYPKDLNVQSIVLQDSKNRVIQTIK